MTPSRVERLPWLPGSDPQRAQVVSVQHCETAPRYVEATMGREGSPA